jgi:hypothetical protein
MSADAVRQYEEDASPQCADFYPHFADKPEDRKFILAPLSGTSYVATHYVALASYSSSSY